MHKFITVNTPLLTNGNEKKYLNECIDTGWISSEVPFVSRFEEEFALSVGRKFAVAVTNGTAALDASLIALGIGKGDEVLMPTFTIISCASAITRTGAEPVFVDCDQNTFNINVDLIEPLITDKTKAIMVVHIYGLPCEMDPILAIAKKYNLKIIEDAAEVHGQTYKDKKCGSFGDVSTFSFYPNKHITSGEGGMIVTDDEHIADKSRKLRNLYFEPPQRFVHNELGFNLRMTNIQAALGVAQLEKLDQHVILKRKIGNLYNDLLKDIDGIQLPITKTEYSENIYWVYSIVLDNNNGKDANRVMQELGKNQIGTRPFFYPMHQQPILQKLGYKRNADNCPVSEKIAKYGFYLPSGLGITESEISTVCKTLRSVLNEQ
jgi:perosamine synthetase